MIFILYYIIFILYLYYIEESEKVDEQESDEEERVVSSDWGNDKLRPSEFASRLKVEKVQIELTEDPSKS